MKISEQWLREWVSVPFAREVLTEKLTLAGLEVDAVTPVSEALSGVVVAEVLSVSPVADSDHLAVCTVADGRGESQVICGAPNVRPGLRTAYARPGAVLPGARTISATQIRGIDSAGMLCSAAELDLGEDGSGIIELDSACVVGTDLFHALELDDAVLDIGLTPNRGDCFCVTGLARDLSVIAGVPMKQISVAAVNADTPDCFEVELTAPSACSRYAGRVIAGIDSNARTPVWMRERLRRSGVRCIHPVVDVTNFVMLELGQPMHAFDLAALDTRIIVREAYENEQLQLLDGQMLSLADGALVIADAQRAVALAGVMGGEASGVTAATTSIFLESAFFDPIRLAGVARRYGLHTDASLRFERGVDPTGQERAIERATALIVEICGGQPGPTCVSEDVTAIPERAVIAFAPESVNRLLGTSIDSATIESVLRALEMQVDATAPIWQVHVPSFRSDLSLEPDLIEEIARIVGYDVIPTCLPPSAARPALPVSASAIDQSVRNALIARGYYEAITYSFVAPERANLFQPSAAGALILANPISSEMAQMRPSLWPGLVDAALHNLHRQQDDIRLFEIGMVFAAGDEHAGQLNHIGGLRCGSAQAAHWAAKARDTDFFDIKQDVEEMLKNLAYKDIAFVADEHPALHSGQTARVTCAARTLGYAGALHPRLARQLEIDRPMYLFEFMLEYARGVDTPQFHPISRFPAVRRDLSVVVDEATQTASCLELARVAAGNILRDLQLFDVYRGQGIDSGKKSLSLGLIFQDASSTLRDEEVEAAMARVLNAIRDGVGGTLRN